MTERMVDVLNERDTVLHVYAVSVGDSEALPNDSEYEKEALKAAANAHLVPEAELGTLRARVHVCRSGRMTPYGGELN
jgi:hypothetical protein